MEIRELRRFSAALHQAGDGIRQALKPSAKPTAGHQSSARSMSPAVNVIAGILNPLKSREGTSCHIISIHPLPGRISASTSRTSIVFRGETGTVFVINVCHSIFGPIPAPGYHPEGMYEFKIDLNGDAIEDLTYRFTFGERDAERKRKATWCAGSGAQMPSIRMRPARSSRRAPPARRHHAIRSARVGR